MTAEGEYLSGFFAWAFPDRAKRVIEQGWNRYVQIAREKHWKPLPVPEAALSHTMGKPVAVGGVKLQIAVRDLPRGVVNRPGRREWEQCAYNLKWLDLTREEARSFVTSEKTPQAVPRRILEKMSLTVLKDCARGQCTDWPKGALRQGRLTVERIRAQGGTWTMAIRGFVVLATQSRSYAPEIYGECDYDAIRKRFTRFELMACGQRTGRTQFNFRKDDLGPAPLGVAFRLFDGKDRSMD